MNNSRSVLYLATEREAGVGCLHCNARLSAGDPIAVCSSCGGLHHATCWDSTERCCSYECAPANLERLPASATLKISAEDLTNASPLAIRSVTSSFLPRTPEQDRPRTNRTALAAFLCALAGIPFFGLLTGLVAILLGSLALGSIRQSRQKGTWLALVGVLLGLADFVGWTIFLVTMLSGNAPHLDTNDFRPDLKALDNVDPNIKRAMQANVLIECRHGWLGGGAIGSGVILRIDDGTALILTNRHVVDPDFSRDTENLEAKPLKGMLSVHWIDSSVDSGTVVWLAPSGIDLALVRAPCLTDACKPALWKLGRSLRVGDPVFAIGNPHGLGWTHTQGTISQFRLKDLGKYQLRIIQTQTVINPGNSGGGLYDQEGFLVGINTWTQDKRVSEGLNFSICLDSLEAAPPPGLDLRKGNEDDLEP